MSVGFYESEIFFYVPVLVEVMQQKKEATDRKLLSLTLTFSFTIRRVKACSSASHTNDNNRQTGEEDEGRTF